LARRQPRRSARAARWNRNPELPRGAIVLVADRRSEFGGKPRPAIVMQHSTLEALSTVTLCLLTSTPHAAAPLLRIAVAATAETGLRAPSWAMIENLTTVLCRGSEKIFPEETDWKHRWTRWAARRGRQEALDQWRNTPNARRSRPIARASRLRS
jgi:mRNA-degrading endonuclease toxin of MazEF toxin-antitoxin module